MMFSASPVRLAYSQYDPVDGVDTSLSPVIFLHGIGASKENWGDIPQNVADATGRKTFAIDARNHGDSEWSEEFSFDLNACDVLHFMETQKIHKVILVGHSMGGITSIKAALMQPRRIEKLIVEDMYVKALSEEVKKAVSSYFVNAIKASEVAPSNINEEEWKTFIMDYIHSCLPPEVVKLHLDPVTNRINQFLPFKRFPGLPSQEEAKKLFLERREHNEKMTEAFMQKYRNQKLGMENAAPETIICEWEKDPQLNTKTLPWWKDDQYVVGFVTRKPRWIKILNTLIMKEDKLEVCSEDTVEDILERYLKFNSHARSYTWKYLGAVLQMNQTLENNGIPDTDEKVDRLGLDSDDYIPTLNLYFNDDLT